MPSVAVMRRLSGRNDRTAHPVRDGAHEQCQAGDQEQEQLEQCEPRREDLGTIPFGNDDHRQLARHIGHRDDFAPVVTVDHH
jgi:hypothetical protein